MTQRDPGETGQRGVAVDMGWCFLTPRNIEGNQPAPQAQWGGEAQNSPLLRLKPDQPHPGTHGGLLDSGPARGGSPVV